MINYFAFVAGNLRFLMFGLILVVSTGFGQSYFITLFGAEIRAAFDLSHGDFGIVFMVGTMLGGFAVMWTGRWIDHMDLRLFTFLACIGYVFALLIMATATSAILLGVAFFALRLSALGMMNHSAMTSMARYFDRDRGKAVSFVALGYPINQATFPLIGVAIAAVVGWRGTWFAVAALVGAVVIPLMLWLVRGQAERHRRYLEQLNKVSSATDESFIRQWTPREALRDPRLYLILPCVLGPGFVTTGLFFHQVLLAETKGWSISWLATSYLAFGAGSLLISLLAGPLIDRFSALKLTPFHLLPFVFSLLVLAFFDHPAIALIYLLGTGVTVGAHYTLGGVVWAELYGTAHLGAIRALMYGTLVFSAAVSPAIMGILIDLGMTMKQLSLLGAAYCVLSSVFALLALRPALSAAAHNPADR